MKIKDVLLLAGRHTLETERRLEHLRSTHIAHPEYTMKDLRMICFESKYMVEKYWKENVLGKVAIIKTV